MIEPKLRSKEQTKAITKKVNKPRKKNGTLVKRRVKFSEDDDHRQAPFVMS